MDDRPIAREMRPNRHPLDDHSATRLLQGTVHPDDAPPGYAPVADLLAAAASLPAADETAGAATISAMVEAIRASAPVPAATATAPRRSVIGRLFAGKAVVAFAIVGLTASGAAAATGSLPDPVQSVVSDAVGHVGVDIPRPSHGKSAGHRKDGEHRQDGKDHNSGDDGTTSTTSGDQADNKGQQTSDAAHDAKTDATEAGDQVGPAVCAAVGSQCQAGQHGGGPPATAGPDDHSGDHGRPGDSGASGEDQGGGSDDGTTPTTGGIASGEDSGSGDLPASNNGTGNNGKAKGQSNGKGKGRSAD